MAFKIRRGTNAERLTITPAQGELIYTTDTKKLYIGDGSTVGGNQVFDTDYVDQKISDLIDGSISSLDTLKELADALGSDPNFASNLTTTLSGKIDNADTNTLAPGDMYFTQTSDTVGMGALAGQSITAGPSGIQIAGTGGVEIMGVATATVRLGGGTSGNIEFNSQTSGIDYNDLDNLPSLATVATSGDYDDLTNKPTIPSISGLATETYVDTAVSNLVNSAGPALDTLKELADALGNDANFATTVSTSLSNKANSADVYTKTEVDNLLWDGTSITNDLIPDTDITYDIGSPTNRFKDIYLSSNTIYLGETALGVDPVKGLQVKSFGGGEGYGAGSVEWLASGAAYGVLHALKFNGVDISHPLYTYLSNLKIGDQIKEAVPPNDPTFVPPADFLLTITEPVQFGNIVPDGFGGQLYDEVVIPVDQSRTTGSTYYVFYVEFRNNPITSIDNIPDPDGILPTATQAGWPEYSDLGISTLRGDQSVFIRPSWNRTPTVDFEFKEDGLFKVPAINGESLFIQGNEIGSIDGAVVISGTDNVLINADVQGTPQQWQFKTDGKLQLPAGGDIVDSAGVSVLGGGGGGLGNNNTVSHINLDGVPYAGAAVNFVHTDNGTEVDILIPDDGAGAGVGITRDTAYGIYNPYREGIWNDTVSPGGTEWNIDGWLDLTDVTTRTYQPLYAAFGSGGLGEKIVGTECVMYLPDNGKYYTVKFTQWTQGGNGGGFAYTRRELDLTSLEEGITFADGTTLKSAEGIGRVKLTAPNNRRIEQAYGYKEVTVTPITTTNLTATASRNGVNENSIWIDSTATTIDDILNNTGAAGIWQFNTIEFSLDNSTWYRWGGGTGNSGDERSYGLILPANILNYNQGDTIYFRYNTGGEPVVWWDKAELPGGSGNFRGAKIDYHAFTGEGTIIGTIHIVDDDAEENITHTEVSSGSTDSENDDLWLVQNEGTISYRRIDGEGKTLKVQWSATVFYGSELYD